MTMKTTTRKSSGTSSASVHMEERCMRTMQKKERGDDHGHGQLFSSEAATRSCIRKESLGIGSQELEGSERQEGAATAF